MNMSKFIDYLVLTLMAVGTTVLKSCSTDLKNSLLAVKSQEGVIKERSLMPAHQLKIAVFTLMQYKINLILVPSP